MILEFVAQQAIGGLIGAGAARLGASAARRLLPGLFAAAPPDVAALASGITNELGAEFGSEGGKLAGIEGSLRAIVENHAPDVDRLVALDLDPDRVVEWALERGTGCLAGLDDGEHALLRNVLRRTYAALLRDPEKLPGLQRAVLQALLEQHHRIAALPHETVAAFRMYEARLLLESGRRFLGRIRSDSVLLRAEYAVVPFHPAREHDLEHLRAWCEDDAEERVLLLHGAGGLGKTRLAIALVDDMCGRGWQAGFLNRRMDDARLLPGVFEELLRGERPLLIVIDYAETRRECVRRLLETAARHSRPKLRVLFLARAAGDWWEATKRGSGDIREFMLGARDLALAPIEDSTDTRIAMFEAACQAFARRLGIGSPPPTAPDLTSMDFGKPLYLHMASLAAVRGQAVTEAGELLTWILRRERDAWDANLGELDLSDAFAQAVALATLWRGAQHRSDLLNIAKAAPVTADAADTHRKIARLLARLYPETPGLGVLRPDILGEELVAEELAKDPDLLRAALASDVPDERIRHAFTVLGRLAGRREDTAHHLDAALDLDPVRLAPHALEVAKELGDPVAKALERLWEHLDPEARTQLAAEVFDDLPDQLGSLYHFCTEVTRLLYDAERRRCQHADPVKLGVLANNLGNRLSAQKQFTEARQRAEEAVDIYRKLSKLHPNAFKPFLAGSLANLATILGELEDFREALHKTEEAVTIYYKLAEQDPSAVRPHLAGSLGNVAKFLGELGHHEEAMARVEEAVRLLAPYFFRLPATFATLILPMIRQYAKLCQTLSREPDMDLLAPILEKLKELQAGGDHGEPRDPV